MRYLLMMHLPAGTTEYPFTQWKSEDWQAHGEFLNRYNQDLKAAGEWVEVQALTPPSQARLVRAGKGGAPKTDGPFPETKEFLAGFWCVEVASPERAYELAAKASAAPGPGGEPLNMEIEVRRVLDAPPEV